jgi:hypothetical protein
VFALLARSYPRRHEQRDGRTPEGGDQSNACAEEQEDPGEDDVRRTVDEADQAERSRTPLNREGGSWPPFP